VIYFLAALLAAAVVLLIMDRRQRRREIAWLGDYIRRLADGQLELEVRDNSEGGMSILKNELYKLTWRLSEQAASLQADKEGLSNAIADISHQLKTPLTTALMMTELLAANNLPPAKRQEFRENLHAVLLRMEWLVIALLKMAKLDSGSVVFKPETVSAAKLVAAAVESLQIMLELRGQQVVREDALPITLLCDVEWTREALTNILKNASEHSPDGGEIRVASGANALYAWLAVTDSGAGIRQQDLPRVFERFYGANKKGGIGIGLAMSRAIMRGQGGEVEVVSAAGQGATFTLKFYK
jgi:signal transduction histidine kinase